MYEKLYREKLKEIEELHRELHEVRRSREQLMDQVRVLELRLEVLHGNEGSVQNRLGLKPQEFRIAHYLANRSPNTVRKEILLEARRGPRDVGVEEVQLKLVDVQISYTRRQLKKHGLRILTDWGNGYYMPNDDADKFTKLIYGVAA
jgi:DNA-binding response OmpR family regulator